MYNVVIPVAEVYSPSLSANSLVWCIKHGEDHIKRRVVATDRKE